MISIVSFCRISYENIRNKFDPYLNNVRHFNKIIQCTLEEYQQNGLKELKEKLWKLTEINIQELNTVFLNKSIF